MLSREQFPAAYPLEKRGKIIERFLLFRGLLLLAGLCDSPDSVHFEGGTG